MTDDTDLSPLSLFEYEEEPGSYALILGDEDMEPHIDTFAEFEYDSSGYGWEGVARSAIHVHAPELAGIVKYDSEASTFVAHSQDLEALKRLGVLLQRALRDDDFLADLLRDGNPDWFA